MSHRSRAAASFAASFAVYAVPIVGPHFVHLWGVILAMEIATRAGRREPAWMAADLALALVVQALAFLLVLDFFRRRGAVRLLLPLAAAPLFIAAVNWAYMIAIPTAFLVERVDAPEKKDWPLECAIGDAWLTPARAGVSLALERARTAFVLRSNRDFLGLTMPGCEVRDTGLDAETGIGEQVSPEGAALFHRWEQGSDRQSTWILAAGAKEAVELEPPPGVKHWYPVLSIDGTAYAWLGSTRPPNGGVAYTVHVRRVGTGEETLVPVPRNVRPPVEILELEGPEILIAGGGNEALGLDVEGNVSWGPASADGIERFGRNLRRHENGLVAWDAYRENERYRIWYRLPGGQGLHEIPKGRAITSVSVDPSGRLLAISVSPNLSIGNVVDAVYVFRAADGGEVYRRNLPAHSRSQVVFLGPGYLALTVFEDGESRVEVLRVVESLPPPGG